MILTRLGNKRKMKKDLVKHFPKHKMRIELFFGAGGSFFYLPPPKYAIVNDLDDDVTNLYLVIKSNLEQLRKEVEILPISEGLINYWRKNIETDPIKKAVRFLLLSNFTYLGKGDTLRAGLDNAKNRILDNLDLTFEKLKNVKIMSKDFRKVIPSISFTKGLNDKEHCLVYMDPIYFGTEHYYRVPNWNESDTTDCLDIMVTCGIKCAMSEFNHPFVLSEARKRGLNIIYLRERANIKNRRTEILITNYEASQSSFDFSE